MIGHSDWTDGRTDGQKPTDFPQCVTIHAQPFSLSIQRSDPTRSSSTFRSRFIASNTMAPNAILAERPAVRVLCRLRAYANVGT
jgi:hypothetical protein